MMLRKNTDINSKNPPKYPVVVLGKSSTNFLGVIRAFGRKGIPVYTISNGPLKASSNRSRYIRERLLLAEWEEAGLQDSLLKLKEKIAGCEKAIVFPTNDNSLLVYSNIRDQLPDIYIDSTPPRHLVQFSIAKDEFYAYLAERKISHPRSYNLDFIKENIHCINEYLSFPFLLKPAQSHTFVDRFHRKLFEVKDRDDFARFYRVAKEYRLNLLAQEMIPGDRFYMIYFYISKDKKVTAVAGFRKVRQSPADYGTGSLIESYWDEKLIGKTLDFLRALNYRGIGEVEYKYDPQCNEFKMLEINARTVTFNRLPALLGLDLEYLSYLDAIDALDASQILKPAMVSIKWADLGKDLISLARLKKEKKITLGQILKSYKKLKVEGYFALDDPIPFLNEMRVFLVDGAKKMIKISQMKHQRGKERKTA